MTRLVLTGGAGTLGSSIVEHLAGDFEEIHIVDNFATGKREALPPRGNVILHEGSIADAETVGRVFEAAQPTHVIHAAASYKDPLDWAEDIRTNVLGSSLVAQESLRSEVASFIYLQTALCYGRPSAVPISVDSPTAPFTSYGISKTAGEQYVMRSGLPATSLRLANVTGPRLSIGPIPTFYRRISAGLPCFASETVRDFLDIDDFIALLRVVLDASSEPGIYNVSTGQGTSMSEVYGLVAEHLGQSGSEVELQAPGNDDVPEVVLDPSYTAERLGWSSSVTAEESIRRLLHWYDRHGVTDIYSHLQNSWEDRR